MYIYIVRSYILILNYKLKIIKYLSNSHAALAFPGACTDPTAVRHEV